MGDEDRIVKGLADIQARYKGKVASFGPLEDLMELYGTCNREEKRNMLALLRARAADPFWAAFVEAVVRKVEPTSVGS